MEKVWAIVGDAADLLNYVEAANADEAIKNYAKEESLAFYDTVLLSAVPADTVRENIAIPGWLLSALERGPEFAFGTRENDPGLWEAYDNTLELLKRKGVQMGDVLGWVCVNADLDLWSPVVDSRI